SMTDPRQSRNPNMRLTRTRIRWEAYQTAPNEWRAITQVADRCGGVQRAAIEACCGAADLAEQLVEYAGWSVQLAHAGYVARLKRSPDKTDFGDARPPGVAGGLNARGLSAGGVAGVVVGA
ncbi:MAG: hypothetical protein QF735_00860, partial [Phycisphaeraceae bacterium]|nr:hypothetical protein [Phycisphaeraceae bacterium]